MAETLMLEPESQVIPKRCCLNCHFLVGVNVTENDRIPQRETVRTTLRELLQKGPGTPEAVLLRSMKFLGCKRGVWNEPREYEQRSRLRTYGILPKERGTHECYFYSFQPPMSMETAIDLSQREYEYQKELAARELENRREARELAADISQGAREQFAQDQEAKRFVENQKGAKRNERISIFLLIATGLAAIAAIAQVVLAYFAYLAIKTP